MADLKEMTELFEKNPIIPGIKTEECVEKVQQTDLEIVFTLFGDIADIAQVIDRLKSAGKTVFVNIDMVDGFSSRKSVLKFMRQNTKADGIISAKASMLSYARELGFFTIHRFFIVDSASYQNIRKQLDISKADFITIVPGWAKVVQWAIQEFGKPVVASGLVCDKESVIEVMKAGAIAICSTNYDVWEL